MRLHGAQETEPGGSDVKPAVFSNKLDNRLSAFYWKPIQQSQLDFVVLFVVNRSYLFLYLLLLGILVFIRAFALFLFLSFTHIASMDELISDKNELNHRCLIFNVMSIVDSNAINILEFGVGEQEEIRKSLFHTTSKEEQQCMEAPLLASCPSNSTVSC